MTDAPLLVIDRLNKSFGGVVAGLNLCLDVMPGEIHAVIGPNGAGKTTLVAQLSGELRPDAGQILFRGHDISRQPVHRRARLGLARGFQISSVLPSFSVMENVSMAVQGHERHSFRFWRDAARDPVLTAPAQRLLKRVGLADKAAVPAATLGHGESRQLELAMALAGDPALLLLDEPVAGMGPEESKRTIALLAGLKGSLAMLLIEHDMDAVFSLADRITVLVRGRVLATGAPETIRADLAVQDAYLGAGDG